MREFARLVGLVGQLVLLFLSVLFFWGNVGQARHEWHGTVGEFDWFV